jgi:ubiquinone/menaquinone biosynthesis C-methylase UbiE
LNLSSEDFEGAILDVGSGDGGFAKIAKKHYEDSNIHSLERTDSIKGTPTGTRGASENLPFGDSKFDLVISHCAFPNVFIDGDKEKIEEQVRKSFDEFIRVTKDEGEIRLSNVLQGEIYENQRVITEVVNKALQDLKLEYDVEIEKIDMNKDSYEYDNENNPKRLLAKNFLIKIRKK